MFKLPNPGPFMFTWPGPSPICQGTGKPSATVEWRMAPHWQIGPPPQRKDVKGIWRGFLDQKPWLRVRVGGLVAIKLSSFLDAIIDGLFPPSGEITKRNQKHDLTSLCTLQFWLLSKSSSQTLWFRWLKSPKSIQIHQPSFLHLPRSSKLSNGMLLVFGPVLGGLKETWWKATMPWLPLKTRLMVWT